MAVPVESDGNYPCHATHLSAGEAQKMLISSGLAPGGRPCQESWLALATSQAYHVHVLARSPIFHTLLPGVLRKTCFHHLPLNCQVALEGNSQPLVPTLAVAPGRNPGEVVQPLHPPQILDPTREGYTQRRRQGSPLAKPWGTSCFIPRIFSFGSHDSKSGCGHPACLRWQTGSASLSSPLRWPWLLGLSNGLPSPWWGLSQQRCPSSPPRVLLLGGWPSARPGSSKPCSGLPSFCLRWSYREDTTLAVNFSIRSSPQGGNPGSLLSLYTWKYKYLNSSLLVWGPTDQMVEMSACRFNFRRPCQQIIHSASFCPCSVTCRNISWRMMEQWDSLPPI